MKIFVSRSSKSYLIDRMVRTMQMRIRFLERRMRTDPKNKAEHKQSLEAYKAKAKIAINKKCFTLGLPLKYKINLPESFTTAPVSAAVANSAYKLFQIAGVTHPAEVDYTKSIVCKIPNARLSTTANNLASISLNPVLSRPIKGSKESLVAALSAKGIPEWFLSMGENEPRLAAFFSKSASNMLRSRLITALADCADSTGNGKDKTARRRALESSFRDKFKAALSLLFAICILAEHCKKSSFAPNREFAKKLIAVYTSVIIAVLSAKDKRSTKVYTSKTLASSPIRRRRVLVPFLANVDLPTAFETFQSVLKDKGILDFLKMHGMKTQIGTTLKYLSDVHTVKELSSMMHKDTAKFKADLSEGKLKSVEPESPIKTYEDLLALTPQNRAWLMINKSTWLMKFLTKFGEVDNYFGGARKSEVRALVEYLCGSDEFYASADQSLLNALAQEFKYKPAFEVVLKSMQSKNKVTTADIQEVVDYGYLNKTAISTLFPSFDKGARLYIAAQLIANSKASKIGVFGHGKLKAEHAKANDLANHSFSASLKAVAPTKVSTVLPPEIVDVALTSETLQEMKKGITESWKANKISKRKFVVGPLRKPTKEEINILTSSLSGAHRVRAFKILGVHEVENPSAVLKSGLSVVASMWHGTDYSAASCIALAGFNLDSSLEKTAKSMGNVVYFAPNADKSMQYLGSGFGFRSGTGILFHGKGYVEGEPTPKCPARPKSYAWTRTGRFNTEEIGLTHANIQFAPDLAYAITVIDTLSLSKQALAQLSKEEGVYVITKTNSSATKFKISKGKFR